MRAERRDRGIEAGRSGSARGARPRLGAGVLLAAFPLLLVGGCLELGVRRAGGAEEPGPVAQAGAEVSGSAEQVGSGGLGRFFRRLGAPGPSYPLDSLSREVPTSGPISCPELELVRHRGEAVRYGGAVRVSVPFRERLVEFEAVVAEVAMSHYGRPPRRVLHLGTYQCRRVSGRRYRLSEHGLGNAIDVRGFSFGPAPRSLRQERPELPPSLRRGFEVTVSRHWEAKRERDEAHSSFLRELVHELATREVFRGMIGPADPRHRGHFHFDHGRWRFRRI